MKGHLLHLQGLLSVAAMLLLMVNSCAAASATTEGVGDSNQERKLHEYYIHNHYLYLAPGITPLPYVNCIPDHGHYGGTEDHHLNGALTGHIHHAPIDGLTFGGKKGGKRGKRYGKGKSSGLGKGKGGKSKGKSKGGKSHGKSSSGSHYRHRDLHLRRRRRHRHQPASNRGGGGYGGYGPLYGGYSPVDDYFGGPNEPKKEGIQNTGLILPLCPPGFTEFPTESPTAFGPDRLGTRRPIGPVPTLSPDLRPPPASQVPNVPPTMAPTGATAAPSVTPGATAAPSVSPGGDTPVAEPTIAPTVVPEATAAPSVTPGATAAPSVTPGEGTPIEQPPNTQRVLVESQLEFGFFEELREPTQEEIDGVLAQTSAYYTELLRETYPDLVSFQASFVNSAFDANAADADEYPVLIEFDANAFFPEGEYYMGWFLLERISAKVDIVVTHPFSFHLVLTSIASTTNPTAGEVFSTMELGDYEGKLRRQQYCICFWF